MSGDMALSLPGGADEDITAAELNAAAAGTLQRLIAVQLVDSYGDRHFCYSGTPLLTPAEAVVDADVAARSVVGTPKFDHGKCLVTITFDTDAGTTKTYAAADEVSLQIQINSTDILLGYDLAANGVTKTFTVV